jgi:hypothetical protein
MSVINETAPKHHVGQKNIEQALIDIGNGAYEVEGAVILYEGDKIIPCGWLEHTAKELVQVLYKAHKTQPEIGFKAIWRFVIPESLPGKAVARLNILFSKETGAELGLSIWFDMQYHRLVLEAICESRQFALAEAKPNSLALDKLFKSAIILHLREGLTDLRNALDRIKDVPIDPDFPENEEIAEVLEAIVKGEQETKSGVKYSWDDFKAKIDYSAKS